jgi:hypothetical protein
VQARKRYEAIKALLCEIQVRTILQDAWATIEHQLVYKNETELPAPLRRDINNVAALLEIAQSVFDRAREKQKNYISEVQGKKGDNLSFLNQPIDLETLLAYADWRFPGKPPSETLTRLVLRDLDNQHFKKLSDIDAAVDRAKPAVDAYSKENPAWFANGTDFITKSLGFVDQHFRTKHPFALRTREAFTRLQHLIRN